MKMRKVPMRTCVVTHERFEKKELIRVVRTPEGEVIVDESGKKNGKGAYLKLDQEVIEKAKKSKALDRALEVSIPNEIYSSLENLLNK